MAILDEVKQMQQQGQSADQIMQALQARGISKQEINDALSQTQIQQAVDGTADSQTQGSLTQETSDQNYGGMEPSMMQDQQAQAPEQAIRGQNDPYQNYSQAGYNPNQSYQSYDQGYNSDSIADIAEQAVEEKLSSIREVLDETLDFKSTAEAKLTNLQERLKRLEEIIDKLQLAVLQKIGDYVTNTQDIKKELYETQKSFKALLPKLDLEPGKHSHHTNNKAHPAHTNNHNLALKKVKLRK